MADPIIIDRGIGNGAGTWASTIGLPGSSYNANQDIYDTLVNYFSSADSGQKYLVNYGPTYQSGDYGTYRQLTAQDILSYLGTKTADDVGFYDGSYGDQPLSLSHSGDPTSAILGGLFDDLGSGYEYGVPEYLVNLDDTGSTTSDITELTDAERASITPAFYEEQQAKRDANRGFLSKYLAPVIKTLVPAAIATVATAGIGSALSGSLGATTGMTGMSAGNAASSGLGSFATDAALSGALKGGIQGYLTGGDLSSALKGAGLGGVTGGYGAGLGTELDLGKVGTKALTDGLVSASGKAGGGDYSGALLSGALGGGASYVSGGGDIPGLGSIGSDTNDGYGVLGTIGETLGLGGSSSDTGLSSGALNLANEGAILPNVDFTSANASDASTSILDTLTGDDNMNLAQALGAGYEAYSSKQAEDKAKDAMMKYLEQNQAAYSPYLQAGQDALSQLTSNLSEGYSYDQLQDDPGYQWQLDQGLKSIDRTQSARGNLYSGAALKEALGYSQGLADQSYNDAYNRWLSENTQLANTANTGLSATNSYASNNNDIGNVLANSAITRSNIDSALLSKLLGGSIFESYL